MNAIRSLCASNESTNARAASLTAVHWEPIELDTSRTSERSTIRRVASPVLFTVTLFRFASFMNVVGMSMAAVTVTVFTPVALSVASPKKFAAVVGSAVGLVAMYPAGKFCLKIFVASSLGLPLFSMRAAPSAAPSTAFVSWAFTTYARPVSTARPVKSSSTVSVTAR